jgi:hypothetical protein
MSTRGFVVVLGLLLLTSVRCAHTSATPEQRACKKRVDECMEGCPEPAGPAEPSGTGCGHTTQTECEKRCYEDCW